MLNPEINLDPGKTNLLEVMLRSSPHHDKTESDWDTPNIRNPDSLAWLSPGAAPARGAPSRGYSLAAVGAAAAFLIVCCVLSVCFRRCLGTGSGSRVDDHSAVLCRLMLGWVQDFVDDPGTSRTCTAAPSMRQDLVGTQGLEGTKARLLDFVQLWELGLAWRLSF